MQVDITYEDGHKTTVPIESVLELPKVGTEITCATCKQKTRISRVGIPYRVERIDASGNENQQSLLKGE